MMDDGTEKECKTGDVSLLPSGHDAWVVGNEPVVVVDFQGMVDYAKQSEKKYDGLGGKDSNLVGNANVAI